MSPHRALASTLRLGKTVSARELWVGILKDQQNRNL